MQTSEAHRLERGKAVEGWAFTFCKAAFLALLFQRYAVLVLSLLAASLYMVAALYGVREWRCWVKPPWVVVFFIVVAASQVYLLFFRH